uniref:isocitrate/isopropylmalate family dehydrogenase n=1 Tax=Nocardia cyriacigeorgica TaxID=135487 RepID=UPI002456E6D8
MTYRIATIPGDGIGVDVTTEAVAVVDAVLPGVEWTEFDWSCEQYLRTGAMMPADGVDRLAGFDAILLGAVGFPGVPDHISLWGLLIPLRRSNIREVVVLGRRGPLQAAYSSPEFMALAHLKGVDVV